MPGKPLFPKIFGKSPIAPIQEHMKVAARSASELRAFIELVVIGDWDAAAAVAESVAKQEEAADEIKREVRQNLPRSLFMPVARSDLLELLQMQDRVANRAKDVAGLIIGRRMKIPEQLTDLMKQYIESAIAATAIAVEALNELDELIVTGFAGKEVELIGDMVERLDTAEHETDVKQIEIRNLLMSIEKEMNPVDVMFLYRIIDWIGDIGDYSQTVGNRLLSLIAR